MTTQHLDDNIIQGFALDTDKLNPAEQFHLNTCEYCREKAESYRLLFQKVSALPVETFDFDLAQAVMQKIEQQEAAHATVVPPAFPVPRRQVKISWALIFLSMTGIGIVSATLYYLQDYFSDLLMGLSSLITILVVITLVLIAAFLGYDEFRRYNKQMSSLDF